MDRFGENDTPMGEHATPFFRGNSQSRIEALREPLFRFIAERPEIYARLFIQEELIEKQEVGEACLEFFEAFGLVKTHGASVQPRVRVNRLDGDLLVCTDLCSYEETDQVFPIHAEQLFLIDSLRVEEGDDVLELGMGSGVVAISAAKRGRMIHAAEINPRAIEFARFNATLNGLREKVRGVESDWFEKFEGMTFDRILSNPPFESVPEGISHFLHSHGGADGLDVVRKFLSEFDRYLAPHGTLQIVTYSIADDEILLAKLVRDYPGTKEIDCLPQSIPLVDFMAKYPIDDGQRARYHGKQLYLVVLTIEPDGPEEMAVRTLPRAQAKNYGDILRPLGMMGRGPTVPAGR